MPVKLALVLDRDEAVRSLLSEMLCDEGWLTVCMAPPPPQHKDLVGLRPDLVILELNLFCQSFLLRHPLFLLTC